MGKPKGKIYPHQWKSGTDVIDHKLYTDCQRARAQATYRGEVWTITESEYIQLWRKDDQYLKKGRGTDDLCLVRRDYEQGWHLDNVEIRSRLEHYQICSRDKIGKFATGEKRKQIMQRLKNVRQHV